MASMKCELYVHGIQPNGMEVCYFGIARTFFFFKITSFRRGVDHYYTVYCFDVARDMVPSLLLIRSTFRSKELFNRLSGLSFEICLSKVMYVS